MKTVYIGSKKSDKFSRVYQKEMVDGNMALRFEVQYNKKRADKASRMIAEGGEKVMNGAVRAELNRIDYKDLKKAFGGVCGEKAVKVAVARSKSDKRADWLIDSVLPTLCKEIVEGETNRVYMAFMAQMKAAMNERIEKANGN